MLAEQFATAAHTARTIKQADELARLAWRAWGEGHLSDTAAQAISEAVRARKAEISVTYRCQFLSASTPPSARRRPASPDRRKSIARRRTLAASGAVPGKIACHFTQSEVSVLTVIAREIQKRGICDMPIDKIAALAGVCRTVVQNALREAQHLRLVTVQERRRAGQPSLTNLVRVVSSEWKAWLRLGGRVHKIKSHVVPDNYQTLLTPDRSLRSRSVHGIKIHQEAHQDAQKGRETQQRPKEAIA